MKGVLEEHLSYLLLPRRLELYREAISRVIQPGDTVFDLGCGTGVLGLIALQLGAANVCFVDSSPALELAKKSLLGTRFADKVSFHAKSSFRYVPEQRADLVVCDHIGFFGVDYGVTALLSDARSRLVRSHGVVMPNKLRLMIAGVSSGKCARLVDAWRAEQIPQELRWIRHHSINSKHGVDLKDDEIATTCVPLGEIPIADGQAPFLSWSTLLHVERAGDICGLAGWFECELAKEVWMTNSPLSPASIGRSQAFFPIEEQLHVREGDTLSIQMMVRCDENLIAWTVEHTESGARFSHSTWKGEVFDPLDFLKNSANHVPRVNAEAKARDIVLSYCDGRRTAAQIGAAVLDDHPTLFPSADEIIRFVQAVIRKNTE